MIWGILVLLLGSFNGRNNKGSKKLPTDTALKVHASSDPISFIRHSDFLNRSNFFRSFDFVFLLIRHQPTIADSAWYKIRNHVCLYKFIKDFQNKFKTTEYYFIIISKETRTDYYPSTPISQWNNNLISNYLSFPRAIMS